MYIHKYILYSIFNINLNVFIKNISHKSFCIVIFLILNALLDRCRSAAIEDIDAHSRRRLSM